MIKKLREGLHLSQNYVAKCLDMDQEEYTEIESGKKTITEEDASKLSELFGVSPDVLLHPDDHTLIFDRDEYLVNKIKQEKRNKNTMDLEEAVTDLQRKVDEQHEFYQK